MFGKDNKNNFKKKVNNNFSEKDFDEEKIIPDSIFRQNIKENKPKKVLNQIPCLLYTSPSPRDATLSRMPSSA